MRIHRIAIATLLMAGCRPEAKPFTETAADHRPAAPSVAPPAIAESPYRLPGPDEFGVRVVFASGPPVPRAGVLLYTPDWELWDKETAGADGVALFRAELQRPYPDLLVHANGIGAGATLGGVFAKPGTLTTIRLHEALW